ncbi:MAG: helix-turn-helix transcriptional regulator [Cellulomonadaceae bacterium]|nr:helix-turn-helix transcriptional regulator [Cellulomonadaceae bacterium]
MTQGSDIREGLTGTVYEVLLEFGAATVPQLHERLADRNNEQIALALESLVEMGAVRRSMTDAQSFWTPSPLVALTNSLHVLSKRMKDHVDVIDRAGAAVLRSDAMPENHLLIEPVVGSNALLDRLGVFMSGARSELRSLLNYVPVPAMLDSSLPGDVGVLQRGVGIRSLYPQEAQDLQHVREYAATFLEHGGEIRISVHTPVGLWIVDHSAVVFSEPMVDGEPAATIVRVPAVINACSALFEDLWSSATRLAGNEGPWELSGRERRILSEYAKGYTERRVAEKLGIASRTVSRIVAKLQSRTGTASLFALAVEAERRGWINPEEGSARTT